MILTTTLRAIDTVKVRTLKAALEVWLVLLHRQPLEAGALPVAGVGLGQTIKSKETVHQK